MKYIFFNDKLVKESEINISIYDRSFLFGDGVFETIRIFNGKILNFPFHLKRLTSNLNILFLDINLINNLGRKINLIITKNNLSNAIIRVTISRGVGNIGYLPISDIENYIIINFNKINSNLLFDDNNYSLNISKYKRINKESLPNKGKINNSMNYILSKIYAKKNNFDDSIILNEDNYISETSSCNIFIVKNNKIYSNDFDSNIIEGSIRDKIMKYADKHNIKITISKINIDFLRYVDEIFITNCNIIIKNINKLQINNDMIYFNNFKYGNFFKKCFLTDLKIN